MIAFPLSASCELTRVAAHTEGEGVQPLGRAVDSEAARIDRIATHGCPVIAVVRALHGLGDMLCAVPALKALRRAHPRARIVLIGLPSYRWLMERFGSLLERLRVEAGRNTPAQHHRCLEGVARERVVRAALELMGATQPGRAYA